MILAVAGSWCALRVEPSFEKHKRARAVDVVTIDEAPELGGFNRSKGLLAHAVSAIGIEEGIARQRLLSVYSRIGQS
jgi:hypothetical protein